MNDSPNVFVVQIAVVVNVFSIKQVVVVVGFTSSLSESTMDLKY